MTERPARDLDAEVRLAAFEWLARVVDEHGDVLPRNALVRGFEFGGRRVPMPGPQGIFKPGILKEVPISITTSPSGPYDDSFGPDGLLLYPRTSRSRQQRLAPHPGLLSDQRNTLGNTQYSLVSVYTVDFKGYQRRLTDAVKSLKRIRTTFA